MHGDKKHAGAHGANVHAGGEHGAHTGGSAANGGEVAHVCPLWRVQQRFANLQTELKMPVNIADAEAVWLQLTAL